MIAVAIVGVAGVTPKTAFGSSHGSSDEDREARVAAIAAGKHTFGAASTIGFFVNGVNHYYGGGFFYTFRPLPYVGFGASVHGLLHAIVICPRVEAILPVSSFEFSAGVGLGPSYRFRQGDGDASWGVHAEATLRFAVNVTKTADLGLEGAASVAGYRRDEYGRFSEPVIAFPVRLLARWRF